MENVVGDKLIATKRRTPVVPSKMCVLCREIKPITDFFKNRDWEAQNGSDIWCSDCVRARSQSKEGLQKYCWYNNRRFTDEMYEVATNKALRILAVDPEYINPRTSKKKKDMVENEKIMQQFFSIMNLVKYYGFVENVEEDGGFEAFDPDYTKTDEEDEFSGVGTGKGKRVYSQEWNGHFTQEEIDYLNDYYEKLEEDFVLDNNNIKDYARKVAKSSLDYDIAYNQKRVGKSDGRELKNLKEIFDGFCQSANFAACKRKPGDVAGGSSSISELVMKVEMSGEIQKTKVVFPKDDVDRILKDFTHTLIAAGLGGESE